MWPAARTDLCGRGFLELPTADSGGPPRTPSGRIAARETPTAHGRAHLLFRWFFAGMLSGVYARRLSCPHCGCVPPCGRLPPSEPARGTATLAGRPDELLPPSLAIVCRCLPRLRCHTSASFAKRPASLIPLYVSWGVLRRRGSRLHVPPSRCGSGVRCQRAAGAVASRFGMRRGCAPDRLCWGRCSLASKGEGSLWVLKDARRRRLASRLAR